MKKSSSKMLKIALTGGIASGKSTVAGLLRGLGVAVIDLDVLSKQVVLPNSKGLNRLVEVFGVQILTADKNLNRAILKRLLFANVRHKLLIESILHPLIIDLMQVQIAQYSQQGIKVVLVEVALLLEANMQDLFDKIIVIDCLAVQQKENLKQRDGLDDKTIEKILNNQVSNDNRQKITDAIIIDNTGNLRQLEERVSLLYQQLFL